MNVLYLTLNPNRQSTTVPTEGWFRFLPPRGLRPVLVSRQAGAFHAWTVSQNIPSFVDPLPMPSKTGLASFLRSMWFLRRLARRYRIDLVHCNEHDVYPIGQYLGRWLKIPVVVSVHFTMDRAYCEWAFGGRKAPTRMFFVSRRSQDACASALDGIVPRARWRVLHNGLDLERFQPDRQLRDRFRADHRIPDNARAIGVACAFRSRKQLEHLFEAASRLSEPRPHVLLAGFPVADEAEYAERLLRDTRALLGDQLNFVGELSDMRGFSNALDLFVNTSREESFGIGVLEALACGCPVVGYDSKAVDEVVLPDGGEIVEQDNIEALRAAIQRWVDRPDMLREARVAARRQAERFDLRHLSQELWNEYQEVAASGPR